ncbi:unnamed protein product [Caenorhabditis bovis]|uniref:Sema domain-containing protein n=1 Tax=Caenorhabditis bovis TaxID=2654633 RepID=A0A8S1ERB9_9PELO|nr:unnamed protein product [Caenorhabditis bovis]
MFTLAIWILVGVADAGDAKVYSLTDNVEFNNPNAGPEFHFQKMVIDPTTTRVFVGGINYLYDLKSENLEVHHQVKTGPEMDQCSDLPISESKLAYSRVHAHTKALAIYDKSSNLIECTNACRGQCRLRNLHNISQVLAKSESMIPYDTSSSTVIFVGPGPPNITIDPVLYVGATAPENTDQKSMFTTFIGPKRVFELVFNTYYQSSSLTIEFSSRHNYSIDYVGGFQSGDYAYFATRQKSKKKDGVQQSRLVRVCTGDNAFHSYTEVPLICEKDGVDYNLVQDVYLSIAGYELARNLSIDVNDPVLFGVFWEGFKNSTEARTPTGRSAVCFYPMKKVEEMFRKNIMDCYKGETTNNLPWRTNAKCQRTKLEWNAVKCGKDVNSMIGGNTPIIGTATYTADEMFTSIAVNTTKSNTVAFVGSETGQLHKILLKAHESSEKYATETISNEPILGDMELSGDGKFIYILTRSRVIKSPTSRCETTVSSCHACLDRRDPYCGWCVRNNYCTQEDTCELVVPRASGGWLDYQYSRCPTIKSVVPEEIQITTADFLNVTVEHLELSKNKQLQCIFHFPNGEEVKSEPASFDGSLKCATPPKEKLPRIEKDQVHLDSELRIVAEGSNLPLAFSNFTFYDCSRYTTCTECAASQFPCDWCMKSNECVAGKLSEDKCRGQPLVNGLKRDGTSERKGPSKCPHIVSTASKSTVAVGERSNISVKIQNVDTKFMGDFRCQFRYGSTVHEKLAIKSSEDTITCEEMLFEPYGASLADGHVFYDFNVMWSSPMSRQSYSLDNIKKVAIDVYSCEKLAANCGRCLTLNDEYECGWCSAQRKCTRQRSCSATSPLQFLDRGQLCADPLILDFNPKKGTVAGGTRITIVGNNLGRSVADIQNAVQVANVNCKVVPEEYEPSSKIVCDTQKPPMNNPNQRGKIVVTLRNEEGFYTHSAQYFSFVEPKVTGIEPKTGPRSGGTDVALFGMDLDAGSSVVVKFGEVGCEVLTRSSNKLICRTGNADTTGERPLTIFFDSKLVRQRDLNNFEFTDNPRINGIVPNRTIAAGGIHINVEGDGFSLVQRPHMVFIGAGGERSVSKMCKIIDNRLMECQTPPVPLSEARSSRLYSTIAIYEFDLDGTPTPRSNMEVAPDPTVELFSETRFYHPGMDALTIAGNNLNLAAKENDISVKIGEADCANVTITNKVLTCNPPPKKPYHAGKVQPEVIVQIGLMTFSVGELSYDLPGLSSTVYAIILAFIFLMVLLVVFAIVLYRRKSNTHQRQMKYLKTQMDTIEMKVATECKEAFAELQTSLNQYTADLPLGTPTAPFLEYKEYCARVLFPTNTANHPVLRNLEVDTTKAEAIEAGLREFHKLLMNKTFFLTMLRTMENNKYFVGKDRVYVGSLLMVVLQEKMGYCTEMLKQLLRELIEKTVEKKFQPKILFRRSESVAERMLAAWFTFLMHDHIKNYDSGKKLYELYWGIKQQMEKGPQDAITLEARYSLSEEKLLRATFEYKELTVFVSSSDSVYSQPDMPVRVLDCDTITQVKEKCLDMKYRGYRFSERPSASDLELEWRTGVNGRMILQDIDSSSRVEPGNWKRLNTLAHYNVPNNAMLTLTAKSNSLYNLSLLSERSEKSSTSLKNLSPTSGRPWGAATTSSSNSKDMDNGFKLYHLVKPSEHGPSENQEKMVTEIYLTRLLMMKGTLQKFINELLESIFSTRTSPLPAAIKYMFDFMDEQALVHGITDPEVVHAWKSNALPLRFWVNLIKNPHFLFDIQKPTKIEGCLSVVAQTLMDACSTQDHQLTKDSPSSKLLFAKDMYQFREWVDSYYTEISRMPPIGDQEMGNILSAESRQHCGEFHVFSALNELYKYLDQYKESIMDALEANEHAQASRLPGRLQDLLALMESDFGRATDYESSTLGLGYNSNSRLMPRDRF